MFQSNYNTVAFQYFKLNDERIFRGDREYEYEFHLGQVDIGELMERWMLVDGWTGWNISKLQEERFFSETFRFLSFPRGGDDTWDAQVVQVVFALGEKAGNS